jgi:phosphonate transport system ATP-binding protein
MSILAKHLSKSFDGGRHFALDDVNLEITQGEFVAVIGPSGAGKSTFLRAINGTNPPGTGRLEVLGKNIPDLKGKDLVAVRKKIGFIFQQFNLIKNISVLKNVLVGRIAYSPLWRTLTALYSKEDQALAQAALDSVGLEARHDDLVRNLSGGQQQRVAIARALVQDPRIILADEPMASLDHKLAETVYAILQRINEEKQITVIVNIHALDLAKKYAKRIIAFREGKVVFDGPTHALGEKEILKIYEGGV